jgi:hypothetical protein
MPDWVSDIFKTVLPSLILAIFTSILTVYFALRRFQKEKWWEKKEETYSKLLETLHHLKNYAAKHFEGHMTDEEEQELTKDWKNITREFSKLRDLASLHLSEEALAILGEYKKKKAEARKSKDVNNWIEGDLVAAGEGEMIT